MEKSMFFNRVNGKCQTIQQRGTNVQFDLRKRKTLMRKCLMIGVVMFLAIAGTTFAQYKNWEHSGSLYLDTTPEGANLPATAHEKDFPLLIRLNKGWFDFSQTKANGDDSFRQMITYEVSWNQLPIGHFREKITFIVQYGREHKENIEIELPIKGDIVG